MGWDPRLWQTPLGQFVRQYGAQELADVLNYHRSAVYHWVAGTVSPYPETAQRVVELAQRRRFRVTEGRREPRKLSLDDVIFGQRKEVARILEAQKSPRKEKNEHAGT